MARVAADTANNTKPVRPSTTMYYGIKLRSKNMLSKSKVLSYNNMGDTSTGYDISIQSDRHKLYPFTKDVNHNCEL